MSRLIETRILNPLVGETIPAPTYATDGSAAMDLRACLTNPMVLEPGDRKLVSTGIAINMMDSGLVAIVVSRSGLSLKNGIRVAQGVGVIDSDYHGELSVILINEGQSPYTILAGDRIAQLMFMPVIQVKLHFVNEFSIETERDQGGFGSTGRA